MGFVVLHIQKLKGNDARTSAHIERTVDPANADQTRTHLNETLIDYPDGVENRTQAIQHRIENAPYYLYFSLYCKNKNIKKE